MQLKLADQFNLSLSGSAEDLSSETLFSSPPCPSLYHDLLDSLREELLPEAGVGGEGEVGGGGEGELREGEVGGGREGEVGGGGEGEVGGGGEGEVEGEGEVGGGGEGDVVGGGEGDVGRGEEEGRAGGDMRVGEDVKEPEARPEEVMVPESERRGGEGREGSGSPEPALELRGMTSMLQQYLLSLTSHTPPPHK